MSEWYNKRRAERVRLGLCSQCGDKDPIVGRKMCSECADHGAKTTRKNVGRSRNKVRREVFTAYGGFKCSCQPCGITIESFLCIDLIDNSKGGHKGETGTGHNFYSWLRSNGYPAGY